MQQQKKAISAACHELSCRFAKEASATKPEMLADVDFLDVTVPPRLMPTFGGKARITAFITEKARASRLNSNGDWASTTAHHGRGGT